MVCILVHADVGRLHSAYIHIVYQATFIHEPVGWIIPPPFLVFFFFAFGARERVTLALFTPQQHRGGE